MRAIGPDISFYQDDDDTPQGVDFDVMKDAPSDFVIIRAGQCNWIDPDFATNWAEAKKAGLPRGSYWYYDSRCSPESQAHIWASALGDDLGEIALFADFEENYNGAWGGPNHFYAFLTELELLVDKEIIIYTSYYYWKDNVPSNLRQLFSPWALWAARYSSNEPMMIEPWDDWTLWQYTAVGDGPAYGVESKGIDLNYYNGNEEDFRARFKLDEVEPPTPPTTGDDMTDAILEVAKQIGRVADAIEGSSVPPTDDDTTDDKPAEYPKHWQLVNPQTSGNVPFYRNDDANDSKIKVWKDNVVSEYLPPQKYWDSKADLENVLREWAWIPRCVVHNAGGKSMMMPDDFTANTGKDTSNWFGGAFVNRSRLEAA